MSSGIEGNSSEQNFGAGLFLDTSVFLGYPIGAAIGASLVDPHDSVVMSMAGSLTGCLASVFFPRERTYRFRGSNWDVVWNWFVGPLVGATLASELWRKPAESCPVSIDLVPDSKGRLSVTTTLRF